MLEMMLSGGGDPNLVSWSGPGAKKLIAGNKEAGYFGTVSPGELFSMAELNAMVTSTTKQTYALTLWHKFILNNSKVFYIPSSYVLGKVTWKDLYNSGLVYGKKGFGRSPLPAGMTEVEQFNVRVKPESIKGKIQYWPLVVRAPYGTDTDPYVDLSILSDELKLFDNVVRGPWATNSIVSSLSLMLERNSGSTIAYRRNLSSLNNPMGSYSMEVVGSENMGSASAASYAWTPVVELVRDPNIVLDPYAVTAAAMDASITTPVPSIGFTGVSVVGLSNVVITTGKSLKPFNAVIETTLPIVVGQAIGAAQSLMVSVTDGPSVKPVSTITTTPSQQPSPYLQVNEARPVVVGATPDLSNRIAVSFETGGLVVPISNIVATPSQQQNPLVIISAITD